MTTNVIERNASTAFLGLLITVAGLFVLPWFLPIPTVLSVSLGIFGFVLTLFEGRGIYSLFAGGLVGLSLFTLVLTNAPDSPDLEEPIPVLSGYGFKLDPDSTNREHLYDSEPMSPARARVAAIEVADHYVTALAPEWTVIDRDQRPDVSYVKLRDGDSSRGISIFVGVVVTPLGQRAALDLRIQALLCREDLPGLAPGEVTCMTAPISHLASYPDGEPMVPSPQPSPGPLREPVPLPSGYGFSLDTGLSSEDMHAYRSAIMSIPEARRAERLVLRYYRQALDEWILVAKDERFLLIKDPDSTDGLGIEADWSIYVGEVSGIVELEIRAIICPDDYTCNWRPLF